MKPSWFHDVVNETIFKFGYSIPVAASEIKEEPFIEMFRGAGDKTPPLYAFHTVRAKIRS